MRVVVHYFAEELGTIQGTPLIPIELDVAPSMEVGILKYMACYASNLIEDMMALMRPQDPTPEESDYFNPFRPLPEIPRSARDPSDFLGMFYRRRLNENLKMAELGTYHLGLSIDIYWLLKCPVCGFFNGGSSPERTRGCDNTPDLHVIYSCLNPKCREHKVRKMYTIRIARWTEEDGNVCILPFITSVWNGASCAVIHGSRTNPPSHCNMNAEIPELSKSEHCRCGAINPPDASFCWNCGKKNRGVRPKTEMVLPDDPDSLQT
jgi:ribosomal protein L40E